MFSIDTCTIFESLRGNVRSKNVLFNSETIGYYSVSIGGNTPYGWGELYTPNNAFCSQVRLVGEFLSEDKEGYFFSQNFKDHLTDIEPLVFSEEQLSCPEYDMDIDSILDKISKYGMASLTEPEKIFLEKNYG